MMNCYLTFRPTKKRWWISSGRRVNLMTNTVKLTYFMFLVLWMSIPWEWVVIWKKMFHISYILELFQYMQSEFIDRVATHQHWDHAIYKFDPIFCCLSKSTRQQLKKTTLIILNLGSVATLYIHTLWVHVTCHYAES